MSTSTPFSGMQANADHLGARQKQLGNLVSARGLMFAQIQSKMANVKASDVYEETTFYSVQMLKALDEEIYTILGLLHHAYRMCDHLKARNVTATGPNVTATGPNVSAKSVEECIKSTQVCPNTAAKSSFDGAERPDKFNMRAQNIDFLSEQKKALDQILARRAFAVEQYEIAVRIDKGLIDMESYNKSLREIDQKIDDIKRAMRHNQAAWGQPDLESDCVTSTQVCPKNDARTTSDAERSAKRAYHNTILFEQKKNLEWSLVHRAKVVEIYKAEVQNGNGYINNVEAYNKFLQEFDTNIGLLRTAISTSEVELAQLENDSERAGTTISLYCGPHANAASSAAMDVDGSVTKGSDSAAELAYKPFYAKGCRQISIVAKIVKAGLERSQLVIPQSWTETSLQVYMKLHQIDAEIQQLINELVEAKNKDDFSFINTSYANGKPHGQMFKIPLNVWGAFARVV